MTNARAKCAPGNVVKPYAASIVPVGWSSSLSAKSLCLLISSSDPLRVTALIGGDKQAETLAVDKSDLRVIGAVR